jgi:uncharacterized damage-inducible protein DinB
MTPRQITKPTGDDPRPGLLPLVGDERELLGAYLDWHRQTFEVKCAGLAPDRLSERSAGPSTLSLHGLLRHLTDAERWWFRIQFAGEDVRLRYQSDDDPDLDFNELDGDVRAAWDAWHEECARSRAILAAAGSLDETGTHFTTGRPVSLRRIMIHMIAEYARHDGHADLLRERIDGATGH